MFVINFVVRNEVLEIASEYVSKTFATFETTDVFSTTHPFI